MRLLHSGPCLRAVGALVLVSASACTHAEPPTPTGPAWLAPPEGDASPSGPPPPVPAPILDTGAPEASPPDSALQPQTTDKPPASSPALDLRIALLWDAIVRDDPDAATPSFFPLGAYVQVKDVGDPASDWKRRLLAAFRRDIHALHAALGEDAGDSRFLSLDVPEARARWVDPGEEWNKIGYFRVFGSRVRYQAGGTEHSFEIKSIISWRGEWFVVHLSAIK
jgi:hypothetical protein